MSLAEGSKALTYVQSKGWAYRTNDTQIICEDCPICKSDGWHFYVSYTPEKDGLWSCFKCSGKGNLYELKLLCGDSVENITSIRDEALAHTKKGALPQVMQCYERMMREAESIETENPALDYLVGRGLSMEVIQKYKLGVEQDYGKKWLVIPYIQKGVVVYAKFRTLPPEKKEFRGVAGREAPLFNQDCLEPGMDELVICEGEMDCLSCLSNGITKVVGIPGAAVKKASWIELLDSLAPKTIYLLYDNDKVGQDSAKEIGSRIGANVKNICLPEFTFVDLDGEEKNGKDINEWFRSGKTLEDFAQLRAVAKVYDVEGIQSVSEVVREIREHLANGGTLLPRWTASRWDTFNKYLPGYEPGDLIGVLAAEKVGKTTLALNILDFLNQKYDEPVLMFCQEMMPARLVRKWMCMVTDTDDKEITLGTVDAALDIAAGRQADFLFGYTRSLKRQEVFDTIRQAVRRYGVKFVCFDNLQMLCRSLDHNAQEISNTTKEFKQLAMELGIVIFLIMQPHALKEGEIVSYRNVYGSSAPGKDVDAMFCLHRNREGDIKASDFAEIGFLQVDASLCPEMLIRFDLSRYSSGGVTTVNFDGARSKVTEYNQEAIEQKKSLIPVDASTVVHPSYRVDA
jgi:5S rRNA maturation endonuclease (ribonuclease M5)